MPALHQIEVNNKNVFNMENFLNVLKRPTAIAAITFILVIVLLYVLTVFFKVALVYGISYINSYST